MDMDMKRYLLVAEIGYCIYIVQFSFSFSFIFCLRVGSEGPIIRSSHNCVISSLRRIRLLHRPCPRPPLGGVGSVQNYRISSVPSFARQSHRESCRTILIVSAYKEQERQELDTDNNLGILNSAPSCSPLKSTSYEQSIQRQAGALALHFLLYRGGCSHSPISHSIPILKDPSS